MRNLLPAVCCCLSLLAPALADAVSAEDRPGPGAAGSLIASPQDRSFIDLFLRAGLAATEAGHLARGRAQHPLVRHYGAMLASDFREASRQLVLLTEGMHLPPLPRDIDGNQKAAAARLQQTPSPTFDREYLTQQFRAQDDLFRIAYLQAVTGDNQALRKFAATLLTQLLEYQSQSQALQVMLDDEADPDPAAAL